MKDQLDNERFICSRCNNEFKAIDGCWPEKTLLADGTSEDLCVNQKSGIEWLTSAIAVPFVCYNCIEERDVCEETIIISFYNDSKELLYRFGARENRNKIEAAFREGKKVICDFSQIETINESYADECFGKLIPEFEPVFIRDHIIYKHVIPFLKHRIILAIVERKKKT